MSGVLHGRAVLLLALAAFTSAAATRAIDPLLVPIAQEFGTTPGGASVAATAFLLSYGLLQFFHGPIGDRVGKYRLVFLYTAVSSLSMFLSAFVPTLEMLAAVRFASGAMVGGMITLALAWIGDVVAYEDRQKVLAKFMIGQLVGVGGGAAIAGVIAELYGWRAVFVLLGVLMLAVALGLWLELRANALARQVPLAPERNFAADLRGVFGLLRHPWVRVVFGSVFFEGLLVYGCLAFVPLHLHATLGLSVGASGAMVMLFAAGGLAYALSAHALVPRLGEQGIALVGGIGMALGMALTGFAPDAYAAMAGLFLAGVGFYGLHNTLQTNATQMAPEARGSAVSLFAFGLFGGSSIGVLAGSFFVDGAGTRPLLACSAAGLVLLAIYFGARLGSRPEAR
jgi:predicted MFS family arabinose efflux permease